MKNLKLVTLALALAIGFSTMSFASTVSTSPLDELRSEIVKLIGKTCDKLADETIEAEVVFTINEKGEIVIISVNSTNSAAESFVKCRLNYKKIKHDALNVEEIYHLPLTIVNK